LLLLTFYKSILMVKNGAKVKFFSARQTFFSN